MLTGGNLPAFRGGVHLFILYRQPPSGQVPSLSGHATAYRWLSLPRVLKAVHVMGAAFSGVTMDQFLCASLSPHPLLVQRICAIQKYIHTYVCVMFSLGVLVKEYVVTLEISVDDRLLSAVQVQHALGNVNPQAKSRPGMQWHTVAESLVVLYYRVGTHQIRRRRRAARSLTSQGRAEPLCARITGLNREVSEGKADL